MIWGVGPGDWGLGIRNPSLQPLSPKPEQGIYYE